MADENSDGVIVPEKGPNKEGLPSAVVVEGRTSPKGNGGKTAAARTLRRDTASNELIAVRQAARQSKSVRFVDKEFDEQIYSNICFSRSATATVCVLLSVPSL